MRALHLVVGLVFALVATNMAYAAPAKPDHLNIILMVIPRAAAPAATPATPVDPKAPPKPATPAGPVTADRVAWVTACGVLGTTMTVGNGPWGFGAFGSYACYIDDKLVSGTKKSSEWTLRAIDDQAGLHLSLEHAVKGKPVTIINRMDLPPSEKPYSYFKDLDLADLTAYAFLDSMPMMMMVSKSEKVGTGAAVAGRKSRLGAKFLIPNPPENMNLFEASWDAAKGKFKEDSKGNMNFLGYRIAGKAEQTKTLGREEVTPLWSVDAKSEQAITKGPLWSHNMAGPGTRKAELNTLVDSAYKFLALGVRPGDDSNLLAGKDSDVTDVNFRENFMRGVVSLRYGVSIVEEPDLLKKTSLIGLVTEVRPTEGGGGFRFYYDLVPKATEKITDDTGTENTEFSWSRLAIGWAFGLNVKRWTGGVLDYVEVAPKINLWTLNAKLQVQDLAGVEDTSEFKLANDPNIGWELGLERTISRVLVRAWYGTDLGGFIKKATEKETSVQLNRFGIDSWIAGPRWTEKYQIRSSFLAFFLYETVDLRNKGTVDPSGISGVDVEFAYVGLGTGIQW